MSLVSNVLALGLAILGYAFGPSEVHVLPASSCRRTGQAIVAANKIIASYISRVSRKLRAHIHRLLEQQK
jgi:hypothetical protein